MLARVVTGLYLLALLTVNRLPPQTSALKAIEPIPGGDKIAHVIAYGGLTALAAGLCGAGASARGATALLIAVGGLAIADELTQPWWGRTADVWDALADMVGATGGWWAGRAARRWAGL